MPLQSFTRKFDNHSTEEGFQFTFYCDISNDPYKTKFIASQAGKKAGWSKLVGKGLDFGASVAERLPLGQKQDVEKVGEKGKDLTDEIAKKFGSMSPGWHREHDAGFEVAQKEAEEHFRRCPICKRWACDYCWNDPKGMCVEDGKQVAICPKCSQPAGSGKFCNNCGFALTLTCPKCQAESSAGTRFCGQCGARLDGA